jgi:hypothetical protein
VSIQKLVADHAYWADEIRRLKKAGEDEAAQCVHLKAGTAPEEIPMTFGTNCIQRAWDELQKERTADPLERWEYDEIFEDMEPEPCEHCRKVRELRRERMRASKRLGAVRAAITRVGRRLKQEEAVV